MREWHPKYAADTARKSLFLAAGSNGFTGRYAKAVGGGKIYRGREPKGVGVGSSPLGIT